MRVCSSGSSVLRTLNPATPVAIVRFRSSAVDAFIKDSPIRDPAPFCYDDEMDNIRAKQSPFQFKLRTLLVITAIVALFFGIRRYLPKNPCGPVENRAEWPRSLQEFTADAANANIKLDPVRVYLSRVDWIEKYYCLQMSASPELIVLMMQRWPLRPANKNDLATFWRDMPAAWVTPNGTSARRYLASRGHKDDNIVVMIDDSTNLVYIWYWWNF